MNDAYAMFEDTLLVIAAPGVLANDSDPDGNALRALLTSLPAHGAVHLSSDGTLIYFPDANHHGVDSFTYVAGDGEFGSNVATVTITVNPVNDAPVAVNDSYQTDAGQQLTVAAPGVLGNDFDVDSTALTAVLVSGPAYGSLQELGTNGSFTYTPNEGFDGTDTFTYQVFDGALFSDFATATITVTPLNGPPDEECTSAQPQASGVPVPATPSQGQPVTITITATDPCGLSLTIPQQPVVVGPPGELTLQSGPTVVQGVHTWIYLFTPQTPGAQDNTITFTVTNGFQSRNVPVLIDYQPGGPG